MVIWRTEEILVRDGSIKR